VWTLRDRDPANLGPLTECAINNRHYHSMEYTKYYNTIDTRTKQVIE